MIRTLFLLVSVAWAPLAAAQSTGTIRGRVMDADTGEPVALATVVLVESERGATVHEDGTFELVRVAAGRHTVRAQRLGYDSHARSVEVRPGAVVELELRLHATVYRSRAIEVTADRAASDEPAADRVLSGRQLRQQLGRTLAETLVNEAGVTQSSMGPAPARPVIRGLGGDRLLILEDGRSTGDLSSSSPDHAVALDPMNAERIEILRGPAALVYASNPAAGVVNVVRGQIPTSKPGHLHGSVSLQGETVNRGLSGGFNLTGPAGPWAWKTDFSGRTASDMRTPEGPLPNTDGGNLHAALGATRFAASGWWGVSANLLESWYGIPGDFVGAHPNGIRVNMQRHQVDTRGEWQPEGGLFRRVEVLAHGSRYFHEELEYSTARRAYDIVGTDFVLRGARLQAVAHQRPQGAVVEGRFGWSGTWSRLTVGGFSYTPPATETGIALFGWQKRRWGAWSVETALRVDRFRVSPDREEDSRIGRIRTRTFTPLSGGLKLMWNRGLWETGATWLRTARMPSMKELYSEGPHLPAYSYEVGDPDLGVETGSNTDVFLQYASEAAAVRITLFHIRFGGYLYPRNTGEEAVARPLPIYQYTGADAALVGFESVAEWHLSRNWVATVTASAVEGTLTDSGEPLPFIPPLTGKLDLAHTRGAVTLSSSLRLAAAQERTGAFETPTEGYAVWDLGVQWYGSRGGRLHTVAAKLDNVTDAAYRMHLSRVKAILPEPGRSFNLLYRLYF